MSTETNIRDVPTNIITGFLGAGKTSAILHLLKSKPVSERWAVLVNEFGEIGVDGSLFEGQHGEGQGVFIRQVPGGCMCCTAGVPMQVALATLLRRARPDRLLIEPTGLGHPSEVLGVLAGPEYQEALSIRTIITLVDARQLADSRYTQLRTFNEQIALADLIVGNKSDLYQDADREALEVYALAHGAPHAKVLSTENGALALSMLEAATQTAIASYERPDHHGDPEPSLADAPIPDSGFIKAENTGEGFQSVGWRFTPYRIFDRGKLHVFLAGLSAERVKAVFITESGVFAYNFADGTLSEMALDDCMESRVEILAEDIDVTWESQLMACIAPDA